MTLIERVMATQKTVEEFKGKKFDIRYGGDCIQLVIAHARHMGKKIKVPRYGSWRSAAEALRTIGFDNLSAAMDEHFRRIETYHVMAGDIVEVPGNNGFSSLMIAVGNGRTLGFQEEIPHCDILQPMMTSGAWRIE